MVVGRMACGIARDWNQLKRAVTNGKLMGGYSGTGSIPRVVSVIKATQKMIHTSAIMCG